MRILWFILKDIAKFLLWIIIIPSALYFILVYKDTILSMNAKKNIEGKIVYSFETNHIKLIELPSGKNKTLYSVPKKPSESRYLGSVGSPSFSPDGKKIVFSKMDDPRINFRYKLYIMNSDGTNMKEFLNFGDTNLLSPTWSPDGKKIAFVARKSSIGGQGGLYIVAADNPASISCLSEILPSRDQPSWSPDSRMIAFSSEELSSKRLSTNSYVEVDVGGIYIIDIYNKNCKKIINLASQPSWSPDGKRLAYEGENGYYIANLDNGHIYNLVVPYKTPFYSIRTGNLFPIRWSPDGKYIAFGKEVWPGIAGLYVISTDDSKRQIRIATEHKGIGGMSWAKRSKVSPQSWNGSKEKDTLSR